MHPFENRHKPASRELERSVRALSYHFTRLSRDMSDPEELRVEARRAVRLYLQQAEKAPDSYYTESYLNALEAIAREGESFGIMFKPDSIDERRLNVLAVDPAASDLPSEQLLLPASLRERAVARMLEHTLDPPEQLLTREKAEQWIDYETLSKRWHGGWLEKRPETPTKSYPDPDSYVGTRDLDASGAVWATLEEAGLDPSTYFSESPSSQAV